MRITTTILALIFCHIGLTQQLHVDSEAILYIGPESKLEVGGDLENNGILLNTGTMALFGNWRINNIFNGNVGELQFVGGQNQDVDVSAISTDELLIDMSGDLNVNSSDFAVLSNITLNNGVIRVQEGSRFVLESNAKVFGGSTFSYVQGDLAYQGSGNRDFPLGWEGVYAPVSLIGVSGQSPEVVMSYQRPNDDVPVPGDELLGVSENSYWKLELGEDQSGLEISVDSISIDFTDEDLENFEIRNNIRHRINSPVIALSDSPGGVYETLGVASLFNTDSISRGLITSEVGYRLGDTIDVAYLAVALAPRINPNGLVYIPDIFSPAATDPDNRSFRIFGEKISGDGFSLQIFNRFGALIFSTNSFTEANEIGWRGNNQSTGNEEPSGLYYYQVRLVRENGLQEEFQGPFYLQR